MCIIYKYNKFGDLVSFNSSLDELTNNSKLYINKSKYFYNVLNNMVNLKEIKYEELNKYDNNVIIFYSK